MAISSVGSNARPGVCTSTTRPTTPFEGQLIYETDTNRVLVWEGAAWVMVADTDQPPGLQLVKTQTIGSAVASVTVSDAFSADYDNYLVTVSGGATTTNTTLNLQLGSVTSGYRYSYLYTGYANTPLAVGTVSATQIDYCGFGNTTGGNMSVSILSPYLSQPTEIIGHGGSLGNFIGVVTGFEPNATSFTSFRLLIGSGTMTGGTIRVYGYRNS